MGENSGAPEGRNHNVLFAAVSPAPRTVPDPSDVHGQCLLDGLALQLLLLQPEGYSGTDALGVSFRRLGVQAFGTGCPRPQHQHEGAHPFPSQAGDLQDHAPPVVFWPQGETPGRIHRAGRVLGVQTETSVHEPVHRAAADGHCWWG